MFNLPPFSPFCFAPPTQAIHTRVYAKKSILLPIRWTKRGSKTALGVPPGRDTPVGGAFNVPVKNRVYPAFGTFFGTFW